MVIAYVTPIEWPTTTCLVLTSEQHLDPFSGAPKRNLFFGLVIIFRRSLTFQVICLLFLVSYMVVFASSGIDLLFVALHRPLLSFQALLVQIGC